MRNQLGEQTESIERKILLLRGKRVILDRDLAELYGVETKNLNRQVKRNAKRFPIEFMFQLNKEEKNELVTNWHRLNTLKHSTVFPYVFTEHGALMVASILNTPRAIEISIIVIKAFIKLRELLLSKNQLAKKLNELEMQVDVHDEKIMAILEAVNRLLLPPNKTKGRIGF